MASHYPARWYTAFLGLFFLVFAIGVAWLIFRANGFVLLRSPLRLVKTGVISLRIHPDAKNNVFLNDVLQSDGQRDFKDLTPGRYVIRVEQSNFQTWEKTVDLTAGQAVQFHDLILWRNNPQPTLITDENALADLRRILADPTRFQNGLQMIDGEIWAQDQLITRYSEPVVQTMWLPGEHAVLAQLGNTIHAIDLASGLDFVLVKADDADSITAFAPIAGGSKLVISLANKTIVTYDITDPFSFVNLPTFKFPTNSATISASCRSGGMVDAHDSKSCR